MTGQIRNDQRQAPLTVVTRSAWARSGAELEGQGVILVHAPLQSLEIPSGDGRAALLQSRQLSAGQAGTREWLTGKFIATAEWQ